MQLFPWLEKLWQKTSEGLEGLHHGLMITGIAGVGKREFAIRLCQLLLCSKPTADRQPCGQCQNCGLFVAGTHPDFHVLTTETETREGRLELVSRYSDRYQDIAAREKRTNPGKIIPVDQVRLLIERFNSYPHISERKVALILPADRMNTNAANALLKLLEEPPEDSTLILVTEVPGYLPATVRSRCVQINVPIPSRQIAESWLMNDTQQDGVRLALTLSNGGPLIAREMIEKDFLSLQAEFVKGIGDMAVRRNSPLELASQLNKHEFTQVLNWLQGFSCDLIRCCSEAGSAPWQDQLPVNYGQISMEKLFTLYDRICYYRKIAREQLNEQLALEELALSLQQVLKTGS